MLQHSAFHLHLLARCRKEFTINLGVNFRQLLIRPLIAINQKATTINSNDVNIFLGQKLLNDRAAMQTSVRQASAGVVAGLS